jgi:hypothetical protein
MLNGMTEMFTDVFLVRSDSFVPIYSISRLMTELKFILGIMQYPGDCELRSWRIYSQTP